MGHVVVSPEGLQGSSKLPEEKQEKIDEALQQEEDYYRPMREEIQVRVCYPLRVGYKYGSKSKSNEPLMMAWTLQREEALGENDDNWRPALVQLVVDRSAPHTARQA